MARTRDWDAGGRAGRSEHTRGRPFCTRRLQSRAVGTGLGSRFWKGKCRLCQEHKAPPRSLAKNDLASEEQVGIEFPLCGHQKPWPLPRSLSLPGCAHPSTFPKTSPARQELPQVPLRQRALSQSIYRLISTGGRWSHPKSRNIYCGRGMRQRLGFSCLREQCPTVHPAPDPWGTELLTSLPQRSIQTPST